MSGPAHLAGDAEPGRRLRALFLSAEVAPFAKVGGLGDIGASLPLALQEHGVDVDVVMPLYGAVDRDVHGVRDAGQLVRVACGAREEEFGLYRATLRDRVPVWLLENARLFGGQAVYDDRIDRERFFFFVRAALAFIERLPVPIDVVHANDWHTSMANVWLAERAGLGETQPATVLTIHNLAHQGVTDVAYARELGYEPGMLLPVERELHPGKINILARGISASDIVTTVSPRYAIEIQTPDYGAGLDGLIRSRADDLFGIVNGIDTDALNPATDTRLPARYSAKQPAGKAACKRALQEEAGLARDDRAPVLGIVSRLDRQKGIDLVVELITRWRERPLQWALLGSGEPHWEQQLAALAAALPERVAVRIGYDEPLSHRMYAGGDLVLVPSRFEPCGLTQLYGLRYGAVPLVSSTGGLRDTVVDADPQHLADGTATGFMFGDIDPGGLGFALGRAIDLYADRAAWRKLRDQAMRAQVGWGASAERYAELFGRLVGAATR